MTKQGKFARFYSTIINKSYGLNIFLNYLPKDMFWAHLNTKTYVKSMRKITPKYVFIHVMTYNKQKGKIRLKIKSIWVTVQYYIVL